MSIAPFNKNNLIEKTMPMCYNGLARQYKRMEDIAIWVYIICCMIGKRRL